MTLVISRPDSDPDFADLDSWLLVGDVAALPPLSSVPGSPCLIKQPILDTFHLSMEYGGFMPGLARAHPYMRSDLFLNLCYLVFVEATLVSGQLEVLPPQY